MKITEEILLARLDQSKLHVFFNVKRRLPHKKADEMVGGERDRDNTLNNTFVFFVILCSRKKFYSLIAISSTYVS